MSEYDKLVEVYESLSANYKKLESENTDLKKQLLELQSNPPKIVGASKLFSTILPERPERSNKI